MSGKIKVLIDSDVANEIDDQFALAYAFCRKDKLEILGITIAPFRVSWQRGLSVRDGLVDSKNEAYRLMRLAGIKYDKDNEMVFLGCPGFISEGYNDTNPAVEKIISLAKSHKKLNICALGTITNVAMAIKICPEIAKKLDIVWLGTENILLDKFNDSNFRKDKEAFYEVLASEANLTIFPSYMARAFVTSKYEFKNNIKSNNLTNYLYSLLQRFIHLEENMGLKCVYDIGPISYILHKEKFVVKQIPASMLIKDKGHKVKKDRMINYIACVPRYAFIWKDFLEAINSNKNVYLKPNIFFTSDTHFGCERKIKIKQVPFESVEEMNNELVRRWNNKVGPNDVVFHLGDFGDYNIIKKLNGKVTLICGNYEKYDYKDFKKFKQKLLDLGFVDVIENGMYLDPKILGEKVYLTHKPTNHAKDALTLFGHVHTLKMIEKYGFNVCCTYHYFSPISKQTMQKNLEFIKKYADKDVFFHS